MTATNSQNNAGRKPHERGRKGGRIDKRSTLEEAIANEDGAYIVLRKTGRVSVCFGCRKSVKDELFVIQHRCSVPFPSKTVEGQFVMVSPKRKQNHYFHVKRECINDPLHQDFDGGVVVSSAIVSSHIRTLLSNEGFKSI